MIFCSRFIFSCFRKIGQEYSALHKLELDEASDKIEEIIGVPKEIDLNATDEDDDEIDETE